MNSKRTCRCTQFGSVGCRPRSILKAPRLNRPERDDRYVVQACLILLYSITTRRTEFFQCRHRAQGRQTFTNTCQCRRHRIKTVRPLPTPAFWANEIVNDWRVRKTRESSLQARRAGTPAPTEACGVQLMLPLWKGRRYRRLGRNHGQGQPLRRELACRSARDRTSVWCVSWDTRLSA
jgi:hypothetical protein